LYGKEGMHILKNDIYQFVNLNRKQRTLLCEAFIWLGLIRLILLIIPFRYIAPLLGTQNEAVNISDVPKNKEQLDHIFWAICTAGRKTLWKSTCLVQAICGKIMLKLRKQNSTLFLGVAKEGKHGIKAHAWLSADGIIFSGTDRIDQYTVVSSFSEKIQ
jgi:hypothetical protein